MSTTKKFPPVAVRPVRARNHHAAVATDSRYRHALFHWHALLHLGVLVLVPCCQQYLNYLFLNKLNILPQQCF